MATIEYSYLDCGQECSAKWTGDQAKAIARAVDELDAEDRGGGLFVYRAEETGELYEVSADPALAELGAALLDGRSMGEVYSLWCTVYGDMVDESDDCNCGCGAWSGEPCEWSGPKSDLVTIEWMPDALRDSHEAAGNRGVFPLNGAERARVCRECAEHIIEHDGEWARLVDNPS